MYDFKASPSLERTSRETERSIVFRAIELISRAGKRFLLSSRHKHDGANEKARFLVCKCTQKNKDVYRQKKKTSGIAPFKKVSLEDVDTNFI